MNFPLFVLAAVFQVDLG